MRARQIKPAPWRLRWLALSYAVFVLGVCSYVLVWHVVTQPSGAWYWAEPLCLVAQPSARLVAAIEPVSGPVGSLLCVLASGVQAGVVFLLCAWIDRVMARRWSLQRTV